MAVILYETIFSRRPYNIVQVSEDASSALRVAAMSPTQALDWWLAQDRQNNIDYTVPVERETEREFVEQVAEVLKGVLTDRGKIKITSASKFKDALEDVLKKIPGQGSPGDDDSRPPTVAARPRGGPHGSPGAPGDIGSAPTGHAP
jgi:hypothetical protein